MPLYAHGKTLSARFHGFDQPAALSLDRARHDRKPRRWIVDDLVMKGVHADPLHAQDSGQAAPRLDRDDVHAGVIWRAGRDLALIMSFPRGSGQLDILVQGSARGYVQDLDAPADPQHRQVSLQRPAGEGDLQGVPGKIEFYSQTLPQRLAV